MSGEGSPAGGQKKEQGYLDNWYSATVALEILEALEEKEAPKGERRGKEWRGG